MPKFAIPLEKRHYRESNPEGEPYLSEGSIVVEAENQKAAFAVVRAMLDRANPNVLQTTDERIQWDIDWSHEHADMVYEDWTFGIPDFAEQEDHQLYEHKHEFGGEQ